MRFHRRIKALVTGVWLADWRRCYQTLVICSAVYSGSWCTAAVFKVTVEGEEDVYEFQPANNGAGPLWCSGSTCLVRVGDRVYASGLETIANAKPLNNCRWTLYERKTNTWVRLLSDPKGRTREPCPLAAYSDGTFFLSANPTLTAADVYAGPARPEILKFAKADPRSYETLLPVWHGKPAFTEHSYRSLAADGRNRELILFQNIGYTHAEWAFFDRDGHWSAQGQLPWPDGKEYPKPQPIRVCYPNISINNRSVHFCGVSDIVEPYPEWREYKRQLTGQEWDYDFRRLYYTWTPDITREKFRPWVEIASRDKTCGWISPGDLWVAPDGRVHLVWTERAIDERLRNKFFPSEKQSVCINYAIVQEGKVVTRKTLISGGEPGKTDGTPAAPRFHITPHNRLFLCYCIQGLDQAGKSENRLIEIDSKGETSTPVRIPFARTFTSYFTATVRGGSSTSDAIELLGVREGSHSKMSYAKVAIQ